jgi:hypothetical protein
MDVVPVAADSEESAEILTPEDQEDQELDSVADIQEQARKRQADFKAVRLHPDSIIGRRAQLKSKTNIDWFNCFVVDYDSQRPSPCSPSSPQPQRGGHLLHYEKKKEDEKGQLLWVDLKDREFTLEDAMTIKDSQAAVAASPDNFYGRRINLRNQTTSFISGEILDYDVDDHKHEIQFDNGQTILMRLKRYDFVLVNEEEEAIELRSQQRRSSKQLSSNRRASRRLSSDSVGGQDRRSSSRGQADDTWSLDLGLFKISFGS